MTRVSGLPIPRTIILVLLACTSLGASAAAQRNSVALEAGAVWYDAANDAAYFQLGIEGGHLVTPWLRLGAGLNWAPIGDFPRQWVVAGGSETLWRVYVTVAAVADKPFWKSGIAVIDRISPEFQVGVGMVHSAGIEVNPEIFSDPFNGIEDEPTGLALGAALGLACEINPRWAIRMTAGYWSDHLYGGALDDFELTGGVQVSW